MPDVERPLFSIGPDSDLEVPVRAFRTILVLAQQLHYLMDDRLRADGLTTRQAALLTAVTELDRPSVGQVARALGTTRQNVAQLVTALVQKGFLRVVTDPADKRRRCLATTRANERYWTDRDPTDQRVVAEWFSALSSDEIEQLCDLADKVITGLQPAMRSAGRTQD
jgi:DNA-binding MarR family transcriptional regulator